MTDNFENIKSELFKLQHYNWGGDQKNALDKKIISVIKTHYVYDEIVCQLDNQIKSHVERYTLTSWYNTWSSILIEYLFKKEPKVFPALGKIKSVDFFIDSVPLDLKTTFFPHGFIKMKRMTNELTKLKKLAREYSCVFDKSADDNTIKYQIIEQINFKENMNAKRKLDELLNENIVIINEAISDPNELIKWLYENQGEMRFGAENRLFIILIDRENLSASWKLKRDFDKQRRIISEYINSFNKNTMRTLTFDFNGKTYSALADCIFVVK